MLNQKLSFEFEIPISSFATWHLRNNFKYLFVLFFIRGVQAQMGQLEIKEKQYV